MTPAEARVLIAEGARHEPHLAGPPSSIAYAAARRWIENNLVHLLAGYAEALDEIVGLKLGLPIAELEAEILRLRRVMLLNAGATLIERLTASRDAARAGIKMVFQLIDSGDLDLVHWTLDEPPCPEDDTCTCRIRRFMLMLQLAMADPGTPEAISAMSLLAKLPTPGPHDRADCPCGHPLGTTGVCGGCNCADDPPTETVQ